MDQLEEKRLAWQRAQAELQSALAELEKRVADNSNGDAIQAAREDVAKKQTAADEHLHRYITQLGKT